MIYMHENNAFVDFFDFCFLRQREGRRGGKYNVRQVVRYSGRIWRKGKNDENT